MKQILACSLEILSIINYSLRWSNRKGVSIFFFFVDFSFINKTYEVIINLESVQFYYYSIKLLDKHNFIIKMKNYIQENQISSSIFEVLFSMKSWF